MFQFIHCDSGSIRHKCLLRGSNNRCHTCTQRLSIRLQCVGTDAACPGHSRRVRRARPERSEGRARPRCIFKFRSAAILAAVRAAPCRPRLGLPWTTFPQSDPVTSALARANEKEDHFQGVSGTAKRTRRKAKLFDIKILPVTDSAPRSYRRFSPNLMIPVDQRGRGTRAATPIPETKLL